MGTDNTTRIIITADTNQAVGAFSSLERSIGGLGGVISGVSALAPSLAGALSVGAFVAWSKSIIDAADEMNDLSQRIGIGVEQLAKYELAAKQSGTSMESVARGVKGLSAAMLEHGDDLRKAGITAKDADGALRQLSDVFAAMPDGMEKTNLAVKLFGKSGMDLIPMLNMGSKGLDEAAQKSAKYAAALAALAPQADKFNDSLAELSMNGKIAGMTLVNQFLPQLTNISGAMAQAAKESGMLMAIWVGLGGVMEEFKAKTPVRDLGLVNTEIDALKKNMADLGQRRGQKQGWLNDFALGTVDEQWQKSNQRYAELLKERTQLENAAAAATKQRASETAASAKGSDKDIEKWRKEYEALIKAFRDGSGTAKSAVDEFAVLMNRLNTKDVGLDASYWKDLETLHQGYLKGRVNVDEYAAAVAKLTNSQKFHTDAVKEQEEFYKELNKAQEEALAAAVKEAESLDDEVKKQRLANEEIGLTADALEKLKEMRLDDAIAAKEQALASGQARGANIEELAAISHQIEALRELRNLKSSGAAAQGVADAAKKSADEWKKFNEQIEESLTDALMRGFENGDGFGKNFVQSLQNTLKTTVLKVAVQAIVQPMTGAITDMLGGSSGGAGGMLSAGSNLLGTGAGSLGYGAGQGLISLGNATGLQWVADFGVDMAAGEGLAGTLGTAMPYGAAALAVASMLKSDKKPAENTGDTAQYFGASGALTRKTSDAVQSASVDQYVAGMEASYLAAAKNLGIGTVATSFGMGSNTGKQGENPNTIIWGGAGAYGAAGSVNSGEVSSKDAAAVSLATSRAIFAALQGSDIPEYLKGYFNSLTAATASQSDIDTAMAFGTALKSMRDQVAETRTPAEILADQIRDLDRQLGTSATTMDAFKRDMKAAIDAGRVDPATLASWQQLQGYIAQSSELAAAVAAKQHDLDLQLLDATGKSAEATAARRADALKVLDNDQQRSTQKQIWAAQDAAAAIAKAQASSANVAQQAADQQRNAQQQVIDGWKSVTDSLLDSIRQLRGEVLGQGGRGLASAQSEYAQAIAAAKSGDQAAAGRLPELARALVDLGKVNSATATEQALLTARTLGGMQDVVNGVGKKYGLSIPKFAAGGDFAGGARWVGENGPELEITGPSHIFSNSQSKSLLSFDALLAAMRDLTAENRSLRDMLDKRLAKVEKNTWWTGKGANGNPDAPIPTESVR